jgi:hypothetical protein
MNSNTSLSTPDIAVTEALTLLKTIKTFNHDQLAAQFTVATQALDQFVIKGKISASAPAETLYSTADSFTVPTGLLLACSGDLTTTAASGQGLFVLDVRCFNEISIYAASGNVAGSTVDLWTSLR